MDFNESNKRLVRKTKEGMINDVFYSHDLKCRVKQISKRTARKLWDDGREIYLHSSNMRFDNMWQHPMPACKDGYSFVGYTFDQVCSSYETYNCDNERGRYIHFFVKAE